MPLIPDSSPDDVRRRTKIVATLGPASDREGVLEAMIDAGVDVVRLNFSHGTHDSHAALADGETLVVGAGDGHDVRSTAGIVAALGAAVSREAAQPGDAPGTARWRVRSGGRSSLRAAPARRVLRVRRSGFPKSRHRRDAR